MESALKKETPLYQTFLLISWIVLFIREVSFIVMYDTLPTEFPFKSIKGIHLMVKSLIV